MNYRHHYHAGGFADVFKHALLISLVRAMQRKEKPFCYLETHAGLGLYDLGEEAAQKTQEYSRGIAKIWKQLSAAPASFLQYIEIIKQTNPESVLKYYPGSPYFVQQMLRSDDRMVLAELHSQDVLALKRQFGCDKQVAVHHMNGYHALKAFLPPKLTRGLIFIDPPFEKTDEFEQVITHLKIAVHRFVAGVYVVWFPIKDKIAVRNFYNGLKNCQFHEITWCEMQVSKDDIGLQACGMAVINPPWQWAEEVLQWLPWLCSILSSPDKGRWFLKNV